MRKLIFLLALLPSLVFATTIDKIIVFGDSLSDAGNLYNYSKVEHEKDNSYPLIPKTPPYWKGRFSNGPLWDEDLGVTMENLAYGGAWVESYNDSMQIFPADLQTISDYYIVEADHDHQKDQHLYVYWIGANYYLLKLIKQPLTLLLLSNKKLLD